MFPLPLTPLEESILADDPPVQPKTGLVLAEFSGTLHRDDLKAAARQALERHPLMRSVVVRDPCGRLLWVPREPELSRLVWGEEDPHAAVDLFREPGGRAWVQQGPGSARLLLLGHHACCDGVGAMRFLEDLLVAYHNRRSPQPVALRPVEPEMLRDRERTPPEYGGRWPGLPEVVRRASDLWRFFSHEPRVLRGTRRSPDAPCRALATACLGPEVHRHLRVAARRAEVTLNDLLLRELFLALESWSPGKRPLRLMVPLNLRTRSQQVRMPAANLVTAFFLERSPRELSDRERLLEGLREETQRIKRHRLAAMLRVVRLLSTLPGGLARNLPRLKGCLATAVFSNLGNVSGMFPLPDDGEGPRAGEAVLTGLYFFPPLRPLTHAAFSLVVHRRRLHLGLIYDPRAIPPEEAGELLGELTGRLRGGTGRPAEGGPT